MIQEARSGNPYGKEIHGIHISFSVDPNDISEMHPTHWVGQQIGNFFRNVEGVAVTTIGRHKIPLHFNARQKHGPKIAERGPSIYFDWSVHQPRNGYDFLLEIPAGNFPTKSELIPFLTKFDRLDAFNYLLKSDKKMSSREAIERIRQMDKKYYEVLMRHYHKHDGLKSKFEATVKTVVQAKFPGHK